MVVATQIEELRDTVKTTKALDDDYIQVKKELEQAQHMSAVRASNVVHCGILCVLRLVTRFDQAKTGSEEKEQQRVSLERQMHIENNRLNELKLEANG